MMAPPKLTTRYVESRDGTRVALHESVPSGSGPSVLFLGPPGASIVAWHAQFAYLGARFTLRALDTRGLHSSSAPANASYALRDLGADVDAACDLPESRPLDVVAWGLGAVLALDLLHRRPARVAKLALLNPSVGLPLARAIGLEAGGSLAPWALDLSRRAHRTLAHARHRARSWPTSPSWMKRLGLASPTLDDAVFSDMARAFRRVDGAAYRETMSSLLGCSEGPSLDQVTQPVLVVAGDRDRFSPPLLARKLARKLPFGELFVVQGGTHYTPMEYPELVNLRLEKFLDG